MSFDSTPPPQGQVAIAVTNISKCYEVYGTPFNRLLQMLAPRRKRQFSEENSKSAFWALRPVNLVVGKGEIVGIVGRNGSGKSTLLQLVCGTLTPTTGSVAITGRVAALLELGSGFNPEFSGIENVFLNASVLGLTREETQSRLPKILAFADIGEFINQPVKTYSSGMAVRLAFSVAINIDPEVLIVDEALSVGDELFQRKCFSKIESLRDAGTTILFVSHSGGTIIELCDRAILMDRGEIIADDSPKRIVTQYYKLLYAPPVAVEAIRSEIQNNQADLPEDLPEPTEPGSLEGQAHAPHSIETYDPGLVPPDTVVFASHGALIEAPRLETVSGETVNGLIRGRTYHYRYQVRFMSSFKKVRFGMLVKTVTGLPLGGSMSASSLAEGMTFDAGQSVEVDFSFNCRVNPGVYFMNAGVFGCGENGEEHLLHRISDAAAFRVLPVEDQRAQELVDFSCEAKVNFS